VSIFVTPPDPPDAELVTEAVWGGDNVQGLYIYGPQLAQSPLARLIGDAIPDQAPDPPHTAKRRTRYAKRMIATSRGDRIKAFFRAMLGK